MHLMARSPDGPLPKVGAARCSACNTFQGEQHFCGSGESGGATYTPLLMCISTPRTQNNLQKTSLLHAQVFPRTPCSGISEFYSKPIGALWFDPTPLCAEETELLDSNVRGRAGICPSLTTNAVTCCSCHNTLLRKGPVLVMWTSVLSVASLHPWLPFSLSPGLYTLDLVRCRAASGVGCLPAAQAELEGHSSELVLSPARPGAVIVQLLGQVQRTLTRRHQFSSETPHA